MYLETGWRNFHQNLERDLDWETWNFWMCRTTIFWSLTGTSTNFPWAWTFHTTTWKHCPTQLSKVNAVRNFALTICEFLLLELIAQWKHGFFVFRTYSRNRRISQRTDITAWKCGTACLDDKVRCIAQQADQHHRTDRLSQLPELPGSVQQPARKFSFWHQRVSSSGVLNVLACPVAFVYSVSCENPSCMPNWRDVRDLLDTLTQMAECAHWMHRANKPKAKFKRFDFQWNELFFHRNLTWLNSHWIVGSCAEWALLVSPPHFRLVSQPFGGSTWWNMAPWCPAGLSFDFKCFDENCASWRL